VRPPAKRSLLGLTFTDLNARTAAAWVAGRPDGSPFGYVVTPNADHLVRLHRHPDLTAMYRNAMLCLLDSRVVAGIGRLLGLAMPQVAPGSDVTETLLRYHVRPGERITIIGLDDAAVTALVARLGLTDPVHHNPPMDFDLDQDAFSTAVNFVLTHPTRFVFFAVGSPRQERLAAAVASSGRATGTGLCIGASLAFLAGTERRAPVFMQLAGLEWLYRLLTHPRQMFARYVLHSPRVIGLLLRDTGIFVTPHGKG
jgi:exopolysaccharide biosynthesis WecB/TagA/CpsF family protein